MLLLLPLSAIMKYEMDKENIYVEGVFGRYYERPEGERLQIGIGDLEMQRWQLVKYSFMFPTR